MSAAHRDETGLFWQMFHIVAAFSFAGFVCFFAAQDVVPLLSAPLAEAMPNGQPRMVFTSVQDMFLLHTQVALAAGLLAAVPVIAFHSLSGEGAAGRFAVALLSLALFAAGLAYALSIHVPGEFREMIEFWPGLPDGPDFSMRDWTSYGLKIGMIMGLVFQLPLVIYAFVRRGLPADQSAQG
ncbi:twin-arginine translocase subunit TatC [Algicella marina]|nr:twin-arginine translocase subunit TatC [Algicella marina]